MTTLLANTLNTDRRNFINRLTFKDTVYVYWSHSNIIHSFIVGLLGYGLTTYNKDLMMMMMM